MNLEDLHDASIDDPGFKVVAPEPISPEGSGPDPTATGSGSGSDSGELGFLADGSLQPLHENFVAAARVGGWIATANVAFVVPIGVAVLIFMKVLSPLAMVAVIVAGLLILAACVFGAHFWPNFEYRHTRWRLDRDGLEICRGVVWRHTISVPRERIQHTDVARGPIQRRYGLATLAIHTAGTHHSQIDLAGIGYETAQAIRNFLLEEADVAASEVDRDPGADPLPLTEGALESQTTFLEGDDNGG